jgi:hypothetical protein
MEKKRIILLIGLFICAFIFLASAQDCDLENYYYYNTDSSRVELEISTKQILIKVKTQT